MQLPFEIKFDELARTKGKKLYLDGKVTQFQYKEHKITGTIKGAPPYSVEVVEKDDVPLRGKCQCPKAKSMRMCEHMAALMYQYSDTIKQEKLKEYTTAKPERVTRVVAQKKAAEEIWKQEELKKEKLAQEKRLEEEKLAKEKRLEEEKLAEKQRWEEEKEKRRQEKLKKRAERKQKRKEADAREKERQEQARLAKELEEQQKKDAMEQQKREKELAAKKELEERQRLEEERKRRKEERRMKKEEEKKLAEQREKEYHYFDTEQIEYSLDFSEEDRKKGKQYFENGKTTVEYMHEGYTQYGDNLYGECKVSINGVRGQRAPVTVRLLFAKEHIERADCDCPECYGYNYFSRMSECKYTYAALCAMKEYLYTYNIGDATSRAGMEFLQRFQKKHIGDIRSSVEMQEQQLRLEPRVILDYDELSLSFRVGHDKMFVVKDLIAFVQQIDNSETVTYGSKTKLNHAIGNFDEQAQKWISYIKRVVEEENATRMRIELYAWRDTSDKFPSIELSGWRLDRFFEIGRTESISFEDRTGPKKVKAELTFGEGLPTINMHIQPHQTGKRFDGIAVNVMATMIWEGYTYSYYIKDNTLYRMGEEEFAALAPLINSDSDEEYSFVIGRNSLSEFYYDIIPSIEEYVDITEVNSELIQQYLLPDAAFSFYLDAADENITCKIKAQYGEREYYITDPRFHSQPVDMHRQIVKEQEISYLVQQLFPYYDPQLDVLHCNADEDLVFQAMQSAVEQLEELGTVYCTNAFKNQNIIRKMKVSVGVSVSGNLLNLDIETEDVSRQDLLDALQHYQPNKKYYRLKSGTFLNMQDESLRMLGELMDSMHLSPKEFAKGKMHLPLYRTLYLDKLLEENEHVYSHRDKYVKEIVKNFKTVQDADYEEPDSLSKILRPYQKNGYKWMRTLSEAQFGGILADDMGLGKTLQVITLLLAKKEEGNCTPSLIVTPASLVYNWQDELERFAPVLQVATLTGTQAERKEMIARFEEYDVLLSSYDVLKRDIDQYEEKSFLYQIIDEAQYIKNHTTAASKAVKVISAQHKLALTGTPIENRLSELWSIFDYLMPGFLYGYQTFKKNFETPIVKNQDEKATKRLQKMVAPFILRRLKTEVLKDLPEKLEEVRLVQLDSEQRKIYDAQVVHMQTVLASQGEDEFQSSKLQILAELTKLRQICCDPNLCFANYKGESAKLLSCLELIENAAEAGHKMLVFSQFTSMLEILQKELEKRKIAYYTITGATSKEQRSRLVKAFNKDETPVFLISLKAGGVGLNLTGADIVIHYDPWWNLAVQNQATDRAHRMGQTKKVTVYKMIVKHSIEEKILKLQETKKDLADQIVNTEGASLSQMSQSDLLELLEQ